MKQILFSLLTILSLAGIAQVPSGSSATTTVRIKGGQIVDSFQRAPLDTLASAPNGSYATKGGLPYFKTSGHWTAFGSGSGSSDTATNGLQNFTPHSFGLGGLLTQTHTRISGSNVRDLFFDSVKVIINGDGTILTPQFSVLDVASAVHYDLSVTGSGVGHLSLGAGQTFDSHVDMSNIYGNGVLQILSSQNANGEAPLQMTLSSTGSKRPILIDCNCAGGSLIQMGNSAGTGNSAIELTAAGGESHFTAFTGSATSLPYYALVNTNTTRHAYFILDPSGDYYLMNYNGSSIDTNIYFKRGGFVGIGNTSSPTAFLHTLPSTTATASFRIPAGVAPTSPNHGDMWTDASHLFARLSGVTYQLDQQAGGGGAGTVTSVATGLGLSGGTITTTGTILLDTTYAVTKASVQTISGAKTFSTAPILTTTSAVGQVWTATGTTGQGGWGTAPVLTGSNGLTVTSQNVALGGTLASGTTNINGNGSGSTIVFGNSNALTEYIINSTDFTTNTTTIHTPSALYMGAQPPITDANYSLSTSAYLLTLPTITANRTITLTSPGTDAGRDIMIKNGFQTFQWSFASVLPVDAAGNIVTNLDNNTTYVLKAYSSQWHITTKEVGGTTVSEQSVGTLNLGTLSDYVFTGSTTTWTLPPLANHQNRRYYIKNAGSGSITLNAAGSDHIYDTSQVTTITITAGSARIIVGGPSNWYAE